MESMKIFMGKKINTTLMSLQNLKKVTFENSFMKSR